MSDDTRERAEAGLRNMDEHGRMLPSEYLATVRLRTEQCYRALARAEQLAREAGDEQHAADLATLRANVTRGFALELETFESRTTHALAVRREITADEYATAVRDVTAAEGRVTQEALAHALACDVKTLRDYQRARDLLPARNRRSKK